MLSLGFVVLFHVFVIYAFASGLANHLVQKIPEEIKAEVVKEKIPEVKPPPPPPPDLTRPPPPFVPPPEIVIQSEANPNTITVQHQVQVPPPPPPKPVGITQPALIANGRANCASSFYPPIAIRLNQEGITTVAVHIGTDGGVQSVDVTNSSGHDSLDQAAIKCISSAWRFRPAMENGAPVAVVKQYAIKWVLQGQ